jgi:hypothetical protein
MIATEVAQAVEGSRHPHLDPLPAEHLDDLASKRGRPPDESDL